MSAAPGELTARPPWNPDGQRKERWLIRFDAQFNLTVARKVGALCRTHAELANTNRLLARRKEIHEECRVGRSVDQLRRGGGVAAVLDEKISEIERGPISLRRKKRVETPEPK